MGLGGAPLASALWQGGALTLTELAALSRTGEGYALRGTVVGALEGAALAVRYAVECSARWETRRAWVEVTTPSGVRALEVRADGGRWTVDGRSAPELDGLTDVDIQVTPATNTLPIERLGLGVGQEAEVGAAWIQLPSLAVTPLPQRYRRLDERTYVYRSGDFRAELVMAPDGLVERYGSFWRRLELR